MTGVNSILNQCGLYTDLIRMVNDYTVGDLLHWKGKYNSVIHELKQEFKEFKPVRRSDTIQRRLANKLGYSVRRKLACIIQCYGESVNDNEKTTSIQDYFKKYSVVGIHRIAFDNLVFILKQMMKVKDYNIYNYKSNYPPSFNFHISLKLMRHLNDYNHTEYECYINHDKTKIWTSKMPWGNRETQQCKQKIGKELCSIREKKLKWIIAKEQQTNNNFKEKYKLASNIKISHVNVKSVRVSVNTFDGKHVEVTKKISEDKKTNRLYICHPVLKKRRLYADEKYIHFPQKYLTLYKNM